MTEPPETPKRKAAEVAKPHGSDSGLDKGMVLAREIIAEDRTILRKLSKQ